MVSEDRLRGCETLFDRKGTQHRCDLCLQVQVGIGLHVNRCEKIDRNEKPNEKERREYEYLSWKVVGC